MTQQNTDRDLANEEMEEQGLLEGGTGDQDEEAGDGAPAADLMELYPKEDKGYTIRKLRDGDTYRVVGMLGSVMGDDNLRWAVTTGDQNMMMFAGVAALFQNAPREIQLLCADLIGEKGDIERHRREDAERQAREVKARREYTQKRTEAAAESPEALAAFDRDNEEILVYQLKNNNQLQRLVEDEIIEKFEAYPPGTSQEIIAEVMEREDFLPFVTSSMRVYEAGQKLSGRFSTLSSKLSDSQSTSS